VGLPAMVRLVIEEMGEYLPATLPLRRAIESLIVQLARTRVLPALYENQ